MTRLSSLCLLVALTACGGGANDSFYLRFDPLFTTDSAAFSGDLRMMIFQDRIFRTGNSGSSEVIETGFRELGVSWLCAAGDTFFALESGQLVQSTDGQAFTAVSPAITFSTLGCVDDTLVALRTKSFGVAELFVSKDKGANWTQLQDVDSGHTFGTGSSQGISRGLRGRVTISMGVYDDSFGNVNYSSQSYDFIAASNVVNLVSSVKEKITGPARPDYISNDGIGFFTATMGGVDQQGDATNLRVLINPGDTPDLTTGKLLRWAKPTIPYDATANLVILGQDSMGRLLVWADRIYRSKNPLKAEDERAQVLKGPGCDTRHSFTPDLKNDDDVKVTFQNKTGQKVILRWIDNQLRWQRLKELDVGEEVLVRSLSTGAAVENARLMISDPADESCLGVYVVPQGAKEATIVANKP
jgi:hypothetical protein